MTEIHREIVLPAPPDDVWSALTDPERLEEWFANEVELDPRPGGTGTFRWSDGEERRCVVEVAEEGRRLAFDWSDGDGEPSTVDFTLEEVDEGTLLTVVETAPALQACACEWTWALALRAEALHAAVA